MKISAMLASRMAQNDIFKVNEKVFLGCCHRISSDARHWRLASLYIGISSDLFALNVHAFNGSALHSCATRAYRVD